MPGMWECHGHLLGTRTFDLAQLPLEPEALRAARCTHDLRAALNAGITSVRDVGGFGVYLARAVAEGLVDGPAVYGAGAVLSTTGGHGDLHSLPLDWMREYSARDGLIKVCASGGVLSEIDDPIHQQFTVPGLRAIVEVAGLADRAVAAHCHGKPGIVAALRAGVRTSRDRGMDRGTPGQGRSRGDRLDAQREVDLVMQRDAVVADARDLRLLLPGPVDRARPQLGEPEPAALVEAQRVDVVVGGGKPDLAAAGVARRVGRGVDEHGPDADPALDGVERDDLEHVPHHLVGEQADDAAGSFGHEPGHLGGPQHRIVHGDELGPPELGDEPGEHGPIAVVDRPDPDLRVVHDAIMEP